HASTDLRAWSFFDADTYQGLVVFEAGSPPAPPEAAIILDTAAVRGAAVYDLVGGQAAPAEGARADFSSNTTRVPVVLRTRPQILLYARVPIAGFETGKEEVGVADTGLVTAEEVIAAHQRFMADQDYRLHTWLAGARVEYHYKISGSNTFDVAFDNRFFHGADGVAEWQQLSLYLNGVRWKGEFPTIPFIQADKVLTLPLDINLDRAYDYDYLGRDRVEGRDCHVVGFRPRAGTGTLYEGKAWIDARTGAAVRTSVVEHGLSPPVVSNEETTTFAPVSGPDGATYWLMSRVEGQQVFLTAGRNLVVLRSLDFKDYRINDPGYDAALAAAHASKAPMLRDTDQGLKTLVRGADGSRTLGAAPGKSTLFYALGLFYEPGLDTPVPLAGVDYFSFDVNGRKTQINAFLAGAVNAVTLSQPKFLGPFDATVEAGLVAITFNDSYFVGGEEREASRIDTRPQSLAGWLGLPIGSFFRVAGGYEFDWQNYNRDDETETFTVPSDTAVHVLGLKGEFNRGGWTVSAGAGRARRSTWEAWGDETAPSAETAALFPASPCDSPGSCLAEFDPGQDRYRTWDAGIAKQFFLPHFQKISVEARQYGGSNLDRFSQYALAYFGPHVRGFSGSGVRFERGTLATLEYSFSLGDVIRVEGGVDYARIRDPLQEDVDRDFTGAGFAGTLMGPWRSLVRFGAGVALQSDYEALRHDFEAQVVFLKLF
ncbi:MAG TPA: sigma-E factor regulatory protein RseB domain-containing protein, partial [Candidatus Polarisedimenticolia bacterium]|nr:sigma-E factor regulatory protein RseB domain-containing protein [Candidatus Polarisedimenticolia bacterium]